MKLTFEQIALFAKRLAALEKSQKDIDFNLSVWARDLLDALGGTKEFIQFCEVEFAMDERKALGFHRRALAVRLVADAATWNELKGFEQIGELFRDNLPIKRTEQIAIINAAKAETRTIVNVLKRRGHIPAGRPPDQWNEQPVRVSQKVHHADIVCKFIAETMNVERLPAEVRAIVKIYAPLAQPRPQA